MSYEEMQLILQSVVVSLAVKLKRLSNLIPVLSKLCQTKLHQID